MPGAYADVAPGLRGYLFAHRYGEGDDRLHRFYLPALERSVRYDRATGFFSSSALAVAAAGVARLIANGGRMRLLVGAALNREDVEAIVHGMDLCTVVQERLLQGLVTIEELLQRERLAALAWLVAEGRLEFRVVLPLGQDGQPLAAEDAAPYFHAKYGVFTDAAGDQVAFQGSVNETERGWVRNYEELSVYFSWDESRRYLEDIVARFERLWQGKERGWRTLTLPEAVRQQLLLYRPDEPPLYDPLERVHVPVTGVCEETEDYQSGLDVSGAIARFLLDVPRVVGARWVGLGTAPVAPWPHQRRVVERLVEHFPERFLLADEVGLGKTIEAALALRELLLSGRVQRVLLLVPGGLVRQWQEELLDKAALAVPRYESEKLWDAQGGSSPIGVEELFETQPVLLLSSHLAKRHKLAERLLQAQPWDLVVVDEAHHARCDADGHPNRLLSLLRALSERTRGLWLLTATPMQLHPSELWELLSLLGLPGRWGAGPDDFVRYFAQLRKADERAMEWDFLLAMVREEIAVRGGLDHQFVRSTRERLGLARWRTIERLLTTDSTSDPRSLDPESQVALTAGLRRHTPVRRLMQRHTRSLLRRYREKGLLNETLAERDPVVKWVTLTDPERQLYDRIEEYITEFYARYEAERPGLGFVMTVYRRRLTSSFAAVRLSLERRLAFLERRRDDVGLTEEDVTEEELDRDVRERVGDIDRWATEDEIRYLQRFLQDLQHLHRDSKRECLLELLERLFAESETIAVFTEYYDTLLDLREHLVAIYGSQVACYSGRGGEVWQDRKWQAISRAELAALFREGRRVRLLLCTDAASEGLNLQTCGVLVNYDLPWNPMRVEQRIGRFDRIGQRYPVVRIVHLLYEDTVEAEVYRRLGERIDWFRNVVGELQPILTRVSEDIRRLALAPRSARRGELAHLLEELEREFAQREEQELVETLLEPDGAEYEALDGSPPLTLAELEETLFELPAVARVFRRHPRSERVYRMSDNGSHIAVTLDRRTYEERREELQFLTYGTETLQKLLERAAGELPPH
ncbi:MAG: SNF2-related protein, partial [Thermomicrobium sp.]